jgi:ribonucleoside-diphosphate reductase alpha subunit
MDNKEKLNTMGIKIMKRSGTLQDVQFEKIHFRIKKLVNDLGLGVLKNIDYDLLTKKVINGLVDGISSSELDELAARLSIEMSLDHYEYADLASRISVSNLHKNTTECFSIVMEYLFNNKRGDESCPLVSSQFIDCVRRNKDVFNEAINYSRDYSYDYFGLKTLEKGYLKKVYVDEQKFKIVERPQHLLMRLAVSLHEDNIEMVIKCYDMMSRFYFTHASPGLINAGSKNQQYSSCFTGIIPDSMDGIMTAMKQMAIISKYTGGIGMSLSKVRSAESYIKSSGGKSNGIVPVAKMANEVSRFADQGGNLRPGSFALYLEPWHADIFQFLELKLNTGDRNKRAIDLFYGLWIPDLFMKAVKEDSDWYLMDPSVSVGLDVVYSGKFEELYNSYVEKGMYVKKIKAMKLWLAILTSQIETGTPYICYKDAVNEKTNQKNIGTILSSNLCAEQVQVPKIRLKESDTFDEEFTCCNISTVSLPAFVETVNGNTKIYNFQKLFETVKLMTINMNKIIDKNFYPIPETETSNLKHRPLLLGSQGLCSVFFEFAIEYDSVEARKLNKDIFETIYYAALTESCELAKIHGPYSTFEGSPASKGIFQHNMWGQEDPVGLWDWKLLRENVMKYGIYNSLLTGSPPTATTSQLLGNYESFEPIPNNFLIRSVKAGNFPVINRYLVKDLIKLGLWNNELLNKIKNAGGSIQNIKEIPDNIKRIYRSVYEISQKSIIDMSRDRGFFTCQSQSLNIHVKNPTVPVLSSMYFYGWQSGLKTNCYYLRTMTQAKIQKFTVEEIQEETQETPEEPVLFCTKNNSDCSACSG